MALDTMYPAKPNSPQTTLAADITASATSMIVADASVLPTAPNLCTIGEDENAEVVLYNATSGNVVSGLIRGQSGTTASIWAAGTTIARYFTSYDHDTFIDNITDLDSRLSDTGWLTLSNSDVYNGVIYYRRKNGIVYVTLPEITLKESRDSAAFSNLATLPVGFRPSISGIATTITTRGTNNIGILYINPYGDIRITAISTNVIATNYTIYTIISFPV